jgi:hypothetical protein
MDDDKREVRFMLDKVIYDKYKKEAEELDIPLASYIKSKIIKK